MSLVKNDSISASFSGKGQDLQQRACHFSLGDCEKLETWEFRRTVSSRRIYKSSNFKEDGELDAATQF